MPLTAACCGECNDPMRPATMLGLAVRGCAIKRHLRRGGVGGLRGGGVAGCPRARRNVSNSAASRAWGLGPWHSDLRQGV